MRLRKTLAPERLSLARTLHRAAIFLDFFGSPLRPADSQLGVGRTFVKCLRKPRPNRSVQGAVASLLELRALPGLAHLVQEIPAEQLVG